MYTFRQIHLTIELWKHIEKSLDATCFHTQTWYQHLQKNVSLCSIYCEYHDLRLEDIEYTGRPVYTII